MNVTPTDLAVIASAIAKGSGVEPKEKLSEALELWHASARLIDSQHAAVSAPPRPTPVKIPFAQRLRELMPQMSPSFQRKTFHDYLFDCVKKTRAARYQPHSDEKCDGIVRENEEVHKRDGVEADAFKHLPGWIKERTRLRRVESGRAGGAAKHAKRAAAKENRKRKQRKPRLLFIDSAEKMDALANLSGKKAVPRSTDNLPD